MIAPRLRSEARGGSLTTSSSNRYNNNNGVYGGKIHHATDPDLKRALHNSYASQPVKKWEKRWVTIHETSMRVHKWMPAPVSAQTLASQMVAKKTASLSIKNDEQKQESKPSDHESLSLSTQDTQMLVDEESTSQSSLN